MSVLKELKTTCQNPVTYAKADRIDKFCVHNAIYLSWLCIKFKMSTNQVTILSGVFLVIGGVLIALQEDWLIVIGFACFILFYVLDCSDGQVARYNKQGSKFGHFLDWYMHFINDAALFIGLAVATLLITDNLLITIVSLLAIVSPLILKNILNGSWAVICWERLNKMSKGTLTDEENRPFIYQLADESISKQPRTLKKRFFSWVIKALLYIFSPRAPYLLLVVAVIQLGVNLIFNLQFDFRPIAIVYAGIIGTLYVLYLPWRRYKQNSIENSYKLLFQNDRPVKVPEDYHF